jgi:hypothetical protein
MSSYFAYSRPRGIPGTYVVAILIDLQPGERENVVVNRNRSHNCGRCGRQEPVRARVDPANTTASLPSNLVFYFIDHIIRTDTIEVYIFDKHTDAYQHVMYRAGKEVIIAHPQVCKVGTISLGVVTFNKLLLIDWDKTQQSSALQRITTYPHMPELQQLLLTGPQA